MKPTRTSWNGLTASDPNSNDSLELFNIDVGIVNFTLNNLLNAHKIVQQQH